MRVFIGLTEIAGYYSNLKKGFDDLGVECNFISLEEHPFQYERGDGLDEHTPIKKLIRRYHLNRENRLYALMIKLLIFLWALVGHDVFIFGFGSSFSFNFYDLPLLKLFGKKIIFIFNGSDSRPPYINGGFWAAGMSTDSCIRVTAEQKERIRKIDKYADILINYPPQAYFHERPFVLGLAVGFPFKYGSPGSDELRPREDGRIRILHAPSHPVAKGSDTIRKMIENLRKKGYPLDFIEITNVPHRKVIEEIRRCDFIVDQLYSDTPLPGFATEASYFGKPAVLGGYYHETLHEDVPPEHIPPGLYCHPDAMEETVEKLIVDEEYRREMGRKAKEYVRENLAPAKVAARYLRLIRGDVPESWYYDPQNISYLHGCGLSESHAREVLREVIAAGGPEALQLSDKPGLLQKFTEFADGEGR